MKKKWVNEAYITYILVAINCIVFVILEIMGYEPETYYSAGTVGLATTLSVAG